MSTTFKVGDRVKVTQKAVNAAQYPIGKVFTVAKTWGSANNQVVKDEATYGLGIHARHVELIPDFKVGDRVRVVSHKASGDRTKALHPIGSEFVVNNTWFDAGKHFVNKWGSPNGIEDYNVELVVDEPAKTKRVKVSFEAEISTNQYHDIEYVKSPAGNFYLDNIREIPGATVEYIPEPIVLPTKKNAVIQIDNRVWVKSLEQFGIWWSGSSSASITALTKQANQADKYRVIFEGEDA